MSEGDSQSKGEVWMIKEGLAHRVERVRHPLHETKDKCVLELMLLAPAGEEEPEKAGVFRIEGEAAHDLSELAQRYTAESSGDDVLVVMPDERTWAITKRREFYKTMHEEKRSQLNKYIR